MHGTTRAMMVVLQPKGPRGLTAGVPTLAGEMTTSVTSALSTATVSSPGTQRSHGVSADRVPDNRGVAPQVGFVAALDQGVPD